MGSYNYFAPRLKNIKFSRRPCLIGPIDESDPGA